MHAVVPSFGPFLPCLSRPFHRWVSISARTESSNALLITTVTDARLVCAGLTRMLRRVFRQQELDLRDGKRVRVSWRQTKWPLTYCIGLVNRYVHRCDGVVTWYAKRQRRLKLVAMFLCTSCRVFSGTSYTLGSRTMVGRIRHKRRDVYTSEQSLRPCISDFLFHWRSCFTKYVQPQCRELRSHCIVVTRLPRREKIRWRIDSNEDNRFALRFLASNGDEQHLLVKVVFLDECTVVPLYSGPKCVAFLPRSLYKTLLYGGSIWTYSQK